MPHTDSRFQFNLGSIRALIFLLTGGAAALLIVLWGTMAYSVDAIKINNTELQTKLAESALISEYRDSLSNLKEPGNNVIENGNAAKEGNLLNGDEKKHQEVSRRLAQTPSYHSGLAKLQSEVQTQSIEMSRLARQAIEAARAGEHGQVFAVVATEVRKLSERSKNTAAAEELSSTAAQMADQTETLQRLMAVFNFGDRRADPPARSQGENPAGWRAAHGRSGKPSAKTEPRWPLAPAQADMVTEL